MIILYFSFQFFNRIRKKTKSNRFKCLTLRRAEGLSVIFHHNVSRRNLSAGTAAGPLYVARTNIDNTIIHQRFPRHIGGVLSRKEEERKKQNKIKRGNKNPSIDTDEIWTIGFFCRVQTKNTSNIYLYRIWECTHTHTHCSSLSGSRKRPERVGRPSVYTPFVRLDGGRGGRSIRIRANGRTIPFTNKGTTLFSPPAITFYLLDSK